MDPKVQKIIKLHELREELKKKNKFLDYNPITDTIIIDGKITVKCDEIFKEKIYGENIKEISNELNRRFEIMFYGLEKIKKGEIPNEFKIEKLVPHFNIYENVVEINLFLKNAMNIHFKEKDENGKYTINTFSNPFHQGIVLTFIYDIDGIIFPLTVAQFKKLKIKDKDFIKETIKNSQERMKEELGNISEKNGFLKDYKDIYIFNQTKHNVFSTLPGIEKHFNKLNEVLGYYVNKIYLYPINENKFALIDGLISMEELNNRINYLNELEERNIKLGLFQITADGSFSIMVESE